MSGPDVLPSNGKLEQFAGIRRDRPHVDGPEHQRVRESLRAIRRHFESLQQADGHWVAELQGDTILESEWILLLTFLEREHEERARKAGQYILQHQEPHGGWSNYPGGPVEVSVSVKAYFALKLTGHDPDAPYMQRAREAILANGGAAKCNSFTKFYLALLGQLPYEACPSVPPEMVLLPKWFYVNLYAMSSWTRTIVVPLSIFSAYKPTRQLPPERGIRELFHEDPQTLTPGTRSSRLWSWNNFFLGVDWLYKKVESSGWLAPLRRRALPKAVAWMRERFTDSDGLGAIFPPMIYTVISLRCLGVADDDPEMQWALKQLDDLILEEDDTVRLQPCLSPVWDTSLTVNALADAGATHDDPVVHRAVEWLLDKEVRRRGDWSETNPNLEPGGWFFEYNNAFYPDFDDTSVVLMGLAKLGFHQRPETKPAIERALNWLVSMQTDDGGWAAFDRNINREVLTEVPFADHNAMLDPSCPDITARVLESLAYFGYTLDHPRVRKAVRFIAEHQEPNGSWFGRWGVNYIYGTWQVLQGLATIGYDMTDPMIRRGIDWLRSAQQSDGGWGESCKTYDDPTSAGQGETTASQTAWAVLGLIAAGEAESDAVRAGVQYLLDAQQPDGSWHETQFTGTGFPKVFYLRYHYYPLYFPMMALARYAQRMSEARGTQTSSRRSVRTTLVAD